MSYKGYSSIYARNMRPLYGEKANEMSDSDKSLQEQLIQDYADLQRIKAAEDREKEIDYQIKIVKAKLEVFGIVTEDLDIN